MKFFEGCRLQFYFHGGRLVKDAKSGRQFWRLNLVITLTPDEVLCCDDVLRNNYEAIETRDNQVEELKISSGVLGQTVEFFSLVEHKDPALRVVCCDLTELRMTRKDELTELWIKAEIENSDALHRFVKNFAFQRLWAEFSPAQMQLPGGVLKAAAKLTESLRSGEATSMTISGAGQSVTFTKDDAERLHRRARGEDSVN